MSEKRFTSSGSVNLTANGDMLFLLGMNSIFVALLKNGLPRIKDAVNLTSIFGIGARWFF